MDRDKLLPLAQRMATIGRGRKSGPAGDRPDGRSATRRASLGARSRTASISAIVSGTNGTGVGATSGFQAGRPSGGSTTYGKLSAGRLTSTILRQRKKGSGRGHALLASPKELSRSSPATKPSERQRIGKRVLRAPTKLAESQALHPSLGRLGSSTLTGSVPRNW